MRNPNQNNPIDSLANKLANPAMKLALVALVGSTLFACAGNPTAQTPIVPIAPIPFVQPAIDLPINITSGNVANDWTPNIGLFDDSSKCEIVLQYDSTTGIADGFVDNLQNPAEHLLDFTVDVNQEKVDSANAVSEIPGCEDATNNTEASILPSTAVPTVVVTPEDVQVPTESAPVVDHSLDAVNEVDAQFGMLPIDFSGFTFADSDVVVNPDESYEPLVEYTSDAQANGVGNEKAMAERITRIAKIIAGPNASRLLRVIKFKTDCFCANDGILQLNADWFFTMSSYDQLQTILHEMGGHLGDPLLSPNGLYTKEGYQHDLLVAGQIKNYFDKFGRDPNGILYGEGINHPYDGTKNTYSDRLGWLVGRDLSLSLQNNELLENDVSATQDIYLQNKQVVGEAIDAYLAPLVLDQATKDNLIAALQAEHQMWKYAKIDPQDINDQVGAKFAPTYQQLGRFLSQRLLAERNQADGSNKLPQLLAQLNPEISKANADAIFTVYSEFFAEVMHKILSGQNTQFDYDRNVILLVNQHLADLQGIKLTYDQNGNPSVDLIEKVRSELAQEEEAN